MKRFLSITMIFSALLMFLSCDQELNPGFDQSEYEPVVFPDPVRNLKTWANDEYIILSELSVDDLNFQWESIPPAGNTVFRYEVLFETDEGDFSNPIAVYKSDNFALDTQLTLTQAEINLIGKLAGYKGNERKFLRWKVRSYCGLDTAISSLEGRFEVMMVDGIYDIPNAEDLVYITGTATEDEGDFDVAQKMLPLGNGKFEAILKLSKNKTYTFKAEVDGHLYTYYFSDFYNKLMQRLATEENENTWELQDGIYRIAVDFTKREVEVLTEITKMYLYYNVGPHTDVLTYTGQGVWQLKDYTAYKAIVSWAASGEARYHFKVDVKDLEGNASTISWGHKERDFQKAPELNSDGQGGYTNEFKDYTYFDLYTKPGTDNWDYSFIYPGDLLKWATTPVDNKYYATVKTDVTIYLKEQGQFTHRWTVSENQ